MEDYTKYAKRSKAPNPQHQVSPQISPTNSQANRTSFVRGQRIISDLPQMNQSNPYQRYSLDTEVQFRNVDKLKKQKIQLKQALQEVVDKKNTLYNQLLEYKNDIDKLRKENRALKKEKKEANSNINMLNIVIQELEDRLQDKSKQLLHSNSEKQVNLKHIQSNADQRLIRKYSKYINKILQELKKLPQQNQKLKTYQQALKIFQSQISHSNPSDITTTLFKLILNMIEDYSKQQQSTISSISNQASNRHYDYLSPNSHFSNKSQKVRTEQGTNTSLLPDFSTSNYAYEDNPDFIISCCSSVQSSTPYRSITPETSAYDYSKMLEESEQLLRTLSLQSKKLSKINDNISTTIKPPIKRFHFDSDIYDSTELGTIKRNSRPSADLEYIISDVLGRQKVTKNELQTNPLPQRSIRRNGMNPRIRMGTLPNIRRRLPIPHTNGRHDVRLNSRPNVNRRKGIRNETSYRFRRRQGNGKASAKHNKGPPPTTSNITCCKCSSYGGLTRVSRLNVL